MLTHNMHQQPIASVSDPLFASKQTALPSRAMAAEKPISLPSYSNQLPGEPLPERIYVVTVGCFDVFHHGHSALLSHMQSLHADKLIVGIHDDQSIYTNKKLKVAQNLAERTAAVVAFAPEQIEVFEVKNADPTPELIAAYHRYQAQAQQERFQIRWIYMRGKDMPNFPGRSFVESVMTIEWHEYTKEVSSTFIRNEILPLAKSLVNFAREGCLNENMLQLLEKAAMIDHQLVMKYVMQTLNSEFMRSPSSPSLRTGPSFPTPPTSGSPPSDSDDSPPLSSSSSISTTPSSPLLSPDIVSLVSSAVPSEGACLHGLPAAASCCASGAHVATPLPPSPRKVTIDPAQGSRSAGSVLGIVDHPLSLFIRPVDVSSAESLNHNAHLQPCPTSAEARANSPSHIIGHSDNVPSVQIPAPEPTSSSLPPLAASSDQRPPLPSPAGFRPRSNSVSPREVASTAVLLEIVAGLFSLYRDRTERLKALQTKLPQSERM